MLAEHGVDFVVIGGVAVQAHGYIRSTRDLDVIARPTTLNLTRLERGPYRARAPSLGVRTPKLTDPHLLRRAPLSRS